MNELLTQDIRNEQPVMSDTPAKTGIQESHLEFQGELRIPSFGFLLSLARHSSLFTRHCSQSVA
jgi:hypothetical protein